MAHPEDWRKTEYRDNSGEGGVNKNLSPSRESLESTTRKGVLEREQQNNLWEVFLAMWKDWELLNLCKETSGCVAFCLSKCLN